MNSPKHNDKQIGPLSEFQQRYQSELKNISILAKKLAELLQSRGSFDPAVRGARISLRDAYERLLLSLDTSSYASDIEQDLWRLHYIGIEEFRTKIRNLSPSSNHHNRRNGNRNRNQETLSRVVNSFKGFLDEASGYFHALIVKLRAKYGLPPTPAPWEGLLCLREQGSNHCAVSSHRLFIYLGDLARYKELFAVHSANNRDWTVTANYYMQAAALCPSNGNPHNQLAVLATYSGDALGAIYHYCRSLAVDLPFVTARENLTLLLEKKKQHVCKISVTVEGSGQLPYLIAAAEKEGLNFRVLSHLACNKENSQIMTEKYSNVLAIKDLWECFEAHLMQVLGAILKKSCVEELEDAVSKSESVLQQLISHSINDLEMAFPPKKSYPLGGSIVRNNPMLKVVVIVIFLFHDAHKLLQNAVIMSGTSGVSILFRFCCLLASLLVKQAKQSEDNVLNLLLPGVIVFMDWVASQPSILKDIKVDSGVLNRLSNFKWEAESLRIMLLKQKNWTGKDTAYSVQDLSCKPMGQNAIWEDYELLGFCPLSSAHQNLDFSNLCMKRDSEGSFCVTRFIGALHAFSYHIESERVGLDMYNQDESMECISKADAISLDHVHNLKESSFTVDGNQSTSLKDWVQTSDKKMVPIDLPLFSDQGMTLDADEDLSTVHLTFEEDRQYSKDDFAVSIEKSSNELPENSKRQTISVLDLEDSFVYAADHPAKSVSSSKDGKQSECLLDQTKDSLFQTREEPVERPQEASFSIGNSKEYFSLSQGVKFCGCEGTHIQKSSFSHTSDHPPITVVCPHCGKQFKISDKTEECLQIRQEATRGGQKVSFPNSYLKHPISTSHEISICEDGGKRTAEDMTKTTSPNKCADLISFCSTKGHSSQLFHNEKTRAENLRWLDNYTHTKPSSLRGTWTVLYHNFQKFTSGNKRKTTTDTGIYNMIFNSKSLKQYKSKNPFIRKLSDRFL